MKKCLLSLIAATICVSTLEASSLKEVVEHTISNNPDIASKSINNEAFRKYVDEEKSGYYPKLDLTAEYGRESIDIQRDVGANDSDTKDTGSTIQLDAEQLLYDGNLTNSRIEVAQSRYSSNKLKNAQESENIVFNSVKSYLDLLKFDQRMSNAKEVLSIYEDYLSIAKDTESISGEVLDKVQTNAKIRNSKNTYLQEQLNKRAALSTFKKNTKMQLESPICRPNLDNSKVPASLKEFIDSALLSNYSILEQVENIKEQKATLNQADASFLPTLKFKLQGIYSDDLRNFEAETKEYSAKIELKYNIFNGGADSNASEREELFVKEAQKRLDVVTDQIIEDATIAYETYMISKDQVVELTQYITDKEEILKIYKDQFEGGTRTFIDVLDVETDIFNAKTNLVNAEFNMYESYYKILNSQSSLQKTILGSSNQVCSETKDMAKEMPMKKDYNSTDLTELQEALSEPLMQKVEPSNMSYYVLFVESYKNKASALKSLDMINFRLKNSYETKVTTNRNGTFTTVVYNVSTLDEIKNVKEQLDFKFPGSYYKKKTK